MELIFSITPIPQSLGTGREAEIAEAESDRKKEKTKPTGRTNGWGSDRESGIVSRRCSADINLIRLSMKWDDDSQAHRGARV